VKQARHGDVRAQGWRLPIAAVVLVFGAAIASSILPDVFPSGACSTGSAVWYGAESSEGHA
jgi:hypothetical protein